MVTQEQIRDAIVQWIRIVLDADVPEIAASSSLRDLGANSIDRAEIITQVISTLDLNVPLVDLAAARNIGELTELLYAKQTSFEVRG
jgi:polyketide biosynthesis acyl carrier protein